MKWFVMFMKELTDALRDRKALTTALSFALLGPVVLVVMINVMAASARPGALSRSASAAQAKTRRWLRRWAALG
jgi:hypothetical protein